MINVINADCLDAMRAMDAASVDSIVTDPPYGLSFMGKGWDHGVPGAEFWREALRVAKPGAHLVVFGGTRTYHRLACAVEDAGWEVRDCLSWLYGSGFPKSHNGPWGGTALKPAWEPAVLARKSLIGTVAANVAAHGVGGLNVDRCRIGTEGGGTHCTHRGPDGRCLGHKNAGRSTSGETFHGPDAEGPTGRWPANVCLDETAAALLDEQSGVAKPKPARTGRKGGNSGALGAFGGSTADAIGTWPADPGGGASRFFYCAKASKAERGAGNDHPTVKPLRLMRWIVRLVTPPGGLVLDPFAGSGTTGLAARAEGMRAILVEREAEYVEIINRRIAA